jgi:hypothetical protein
VTVRRKEDPHVVHVAAILAVSGLAVPLLGQVGTAFFIKELGKPIHGADSSGVSRFAVPLLGLFGIHSFVV